MRDEANAKIKRQIGRESEFKKECSDIDSQKVAMEVGTP